MTTKKTPQEMLDAVEDTLEQEGHLTRSTCTDCGQSGLFCDQHNGQFLHGNFCSDCRRQIDFMEEKLQEQGKPLQRHVRVREGRHIFFLAPDELWLFMPGRMTKLYYFDPTGQTDEHVIHRVQTRVTFR